MSEPVKDLVIRHERFADGYSELKARIDEKGQVLLDAVDAGEDVREHWGDWDYEYSVTVPVEWKDI